MKKKIYKKWKQLSSIDRLISFSIVVAIIFTFVFIMATASKQKEESSYVSKTFLIDETETTSNISTTGEEIITNIETETEVIIEESSIKENTTYFYEEKITRVLTSKKENLINLGTYKITMYCSCPKCCGQWSYNRPTNENGEEIIKGAAGRELIPDYSVGVDPDIIPYGSFLLINDKLYRADDTGNIKGKKIIDVYAGQDHQEAWNKAAAMDSQYATVYLVEGVKYEEG